MSIKKWLIADLCAIVLMASTANAARIFVGIAPPPAVVEQSRTDPTCWMGLGWRILALDWAPLCLGTRLLGVSAATRGGVDSASLGPCSRRLGLCRRSLGLTKISRDIGCPI
jgi:hypothetical protein